MANKAEFKKNDDKKKPAAKPEVKAAPSKPAYDPKAVKKG